jgi:hypothetical protein
MTGIGISTLRVCILSAAGAACVVAVSTPALIAHAAIAAALGAAGAELLQRRARTVALAIAAGIAGLAIAQLLVETPLAVARLGPARALHAREALIWISLLGPGVWALHALALRYPSLAALEIVVVGLALGAPLAAHRDGMIHRPLALGDLASARGLDPALVLFALGALAALALALLLLRSQGMRTLWHLGAIVLGVAVGWFAAQLGGPAAPQPAADLGLTGPAVERGAGGERSDAASHEQRDASSMSDFRDSYGARGGDTPVAILLFHDDHRPPGGVYYLRQTALSQFNGRRLVATTRAGIDTDVVPGFPTGRLQVLDAPDDRGRTRVTTTAGLLTSHVQPFALDAPVWLEPAPNPLPSRFARTYRARSHAPAPGATRSGRTTSRCPRIRATRRSPGTSRPRCGRRDAAIRSRRHSRSSATWSVKPSTVARVGMPTRSIPRLRSCSGTAPATACTSPTPRPISCAASACRPGWPSATRSPSTSAGTAPHCWSAV